MQGEGIAAGPWPGAAAGGDRAEHGAGADGLEGSDGSEGGTSVAHLGYSQHAPDEFHPIASIWPLLGEPELQELAEDIKTNGLHNPIWRHRDGRIIDGRNRWLACRRAGVDCPRTTYEGQDGPALVAFVVSLNDKRRHLTTDQRAAIAAEIANLGHGQKKADTADAVSQPEAARLMGVSVDSVQRARAVKLADRGLHEKVKRGEIRAGRPRAEVARKRGAARAKKMTTRAATVAPRPSAETTRARGAPSAGRGRGPSVGRCVTRPPTRPRRRGRSRRSGRPRRGRCAGREELAGMVPLVPAHVSVPRDVFASRMRELDDRCQLAE
jgi:ParB-like chromosome segregation protein Spo0J